MSRTALESTEDTKGIGVSAGCHRGDDERLQVTVEFIR